MAIQEEYSVAELETLLQANEVVIDLIRALSKGTVFPNKQINNFMNRVVEGALEKQDGAQSGYWLMIVVDEKDEELNTTVDIERGYKNLIISKGFSRLKQVKPETAKEVIADLIYNATIWFTWGRRYGPTVGSKTDWAERRKESFLKTVEENPSILTELLK